MVVWGEGWLVLVSLFTAQAHIRFRSWKQGEPTSPHKHAVHVSPVFNDTACPVSECQLLMRDLWQAGFTRVWLNPAVKVRRRL